MNNENLNTNENDMNVVDEDDFMAELNAVAQATVVEKKTQLSEADIRNLYYNEMNAEQKARYHTIHTKYLWKNSYLREHLFGHQYQWFKNQDSVVVKWKKYEAYVNLKNHSGTVNKNGELVPDNKELIEKAIKYFNNDSFWLCAHYKMLDSGTSREIVDLKNGQTGLKVFYSSGGSTPGDTFLWILEDNKPVAFKMWVSTIPFGGIRANWKKWKTTKTGAQIALTHKLLFFNINIKNLDLK